MTYKLFCLPNYFQLRNVSTGVRGAVLKSNFDNYVKGARYHAIFEELLGDGIFNTDGHNWYTQRKVCGATLLVVIGHTGLRFVINRPLFFSSFFFFHSSHPWLFLIGLPLHPDGEQHV
jgi:hypothetical protein